MFSLFETDSKFLYTGVVIQVRANMYKHLLSLFATESTWDWLSQIENDATITAVQALSGLLAAVTLNRALIAVHFPQREET